MPGLLNNRRKRPSAAVSEDEDGISDSGSSVSASSKRARYAQDASNPSQRRDRGTQNALSNGSSLQNENGFQPGSLIRVKLTNFVTYTAAEFHLGPSLNMIIGPNGTGKSTLVCAICLGLGWSSENLGRAKEVAAFVKHGASEAIIEIELAGRSGMRSNQIVQRIIRKEDNKSVFNLNGKRVPQTVVVTMAKSFSIQIDNLCMFLPQDRVVEFARMSDVDRLRETQRAAAPPQMVQWHDQLKALRSEERVSETREQNEKAHLEMLEKQQNATRADVERFHERAGLLQRSKCLEKVKPMIEIQLRKKEIEQSKENLRAAKQEVEQIQADVEPIRQAEAASESYRDQIDKVVKLRKSRVEFMKGQADKFVTKIDKDKQAMSDFDNQVKAEVKAKKDRERDIVRITADISRLERQRQDEPVEFDSNKFEQRKAELRAQISAASNALVEKKAAQVNLQTQARELQGKRNKALDQRTKLDTQSGKQENVLRMTSNDTAYAWKWFQENQSSLNLQGEVYGPPILTCSVPDSRYAQAVESQMRKGDVVAITCTNSADWKLLSEKFLSKKDKGGLGLHDVYLRSLSKPLSSYQAPIPTSELSRYGFEGYIVDYIQGPEPVLAMLCDNSRINRIGLALNTLSDQQHELVTKSAIQTWVSGRDIYKITTRREYGASSTVVTQVRKAQWFVDQPTNVDETRELDLAINGFKREVEELRQNNETLKQEIADLNDQIASNKQKREEVEAEKALRQKAAAEWAALPRKIAGKQKELENTAGRNAETNARIRDIKEKSRDVSLNLAALTVDYAKAVTHLRTFHEAYLEAAIRLIEAKSECNGLKNENREILQKLEKKTAEIQQMERSFKAQRDEYKRMFTRTQQEIQSLSEEEMTIVNEFRESSLAELEQEVQSVIARLSMMAVGNPGAIKAYEKREMEINKTKEKLEQHLVNLETTKEQITEIRKQWEPELDAITSKINDAFAHNFEEIGCAGQVAVNKDEEDFDNWSTEISVRFREGETLQKLDSHRQSGGERSVSTIFYLLSLQSLAQSPFRVVDEINQGMDPRNERMVHERMVDIACQEGTSQYFLITPKLLAGLKYHPKMKVHVINSGEHMPDANKDKGGWDLRDMAKIALRTRKGVEVA